MIGLILMLAVLGVVVYLVLQLPMPEPFKTAIMILAIIFAIWIVVSAFGFADIALPRFR